MLIGRLKKSVAPTKHFIKVAQVSRFMPHVGMIRWIVEAALIGRVVLSNVKTLLKEFLILSMIDDQMYQQ